MSLSVVNFCCSINLTFLWLPGGSMIRCKHTYCNILIHHTWFFKNRFYTWRNILIFSKSTCTCHCISVCIISFIIFAGGWWDVNTKFLCHVRCQDCISISSLIFYFFCVSKLRFLFKSFVSLYWCRIFSLPELTSKRAIKNRLLQ